MNLEESITFTATTSRLYHLDREDNGNRLYEFTIAYNNGEVDEMARPKGSKNGVRKTETPEQAQPEANQAIASQLLEALNFVSVAGNKEDQPYQKHVILNNNYAIAHNGIMTAGFPIVENLECCPQLSLLTAAIKKCGSELSITETEAGSLSIKGQKLRATVPCLPFTDIPEPKYILPSPSIAVIDDRLKQAFETCGVAVSEQGATMLESALHLQAQFCTACDKKIAIQYYHGIDLPPNLNIPKMFAQAVAKCKYKLVGFGYEPDVSITFWFENKAFLKTKLYSDKYPIDTLNGLLNVKTNLVEIPKDLFEAFSTVSEFNKDGHASILDGKVYTREVDHVEAEYIVKGLNGNISFNNHYMKMIAGVAKTFDITSDKEKLFFFGDNVRGCLMALLQNDKQPAAAPVAPASNDEIPF